MIAQPFSILAPFADVLDVRFLTKEDAASSDNDIARIVGSPSVVGLWQEHGNRAVRVFEPSSRTLKADAVATDVQGLTLTLRIADCQSLLVYEPSKGVLCLIHAGWKGLQSGVISSAFALLGKEWDIDLKNVFVVIGPSLCTDCADFTDPAKEVPELGQFIQGRCIDLRAAAEHELTSLGVLQNRIERMHDCTRCNPDKYWTYRGGDREKVKEGFVNCLTSTLR